MSARLPRSRQPTSNAKLVWLGSVITRTTSNERSLPHLRFIKRSRRRGTPLNKHRRHQFHNRTQRVLKQRPIRAVLVTPTPQCRKLHLLGLTRRRQNLPHSPP